MMQLLQKMCQDFSPDKLIVFKKIDCIFTSITAILPAEEKLSRSEHLPQTKICIKINLNLG